MSRTTRRTLRVSLVAEQTLADAALVGKHPIGTPEAHALTGHQAVLRLAACAVCERDIRLDALDAPTTLIHDTVTFGDAVRRVEWRCTVDTFETDCPVGDGTMP